MSKKRHQSRDSRCRLQQRKSEVKIGSRHLSSKGGTLKPRRDVESHNFLHHQDFSAKRRKQEEHEEHEGNDYPQPLPRQLHDEVFSEEVSQKPLKDTKNDGPNKVVPSENKPEAWQQVLRQVQFNHRFLFMKLQVTQTSSSTKTQRLNTIAQAQSNFDAVFGKFFIA